MAFRSSVVAIPILEDRRLFTDSTSTYKTLDLEVPQFGRAAASLRIPAQLEVRLDQVSNNEVDWNIDAIAGWDRNHENSAVAFFASDQSTAGPQMLSPSNFVTSTWRQHVRLQLQWRLHTGITAPKEGKYSAILYGTTKGS